MIEGVNYDIRTIDLGEIKTIQELHLELKKILNLPEFYGKNWDAFWDSINGLIEMPSDLIFYNYRTFTERFEKDSKILIQIINDFNKSDNVERIHLDYFDDIPENESLENLSCLFESKPFQWGLRGNPHLWIELQDYFKQITIAKDEDELISQVHEGIKILTGESIHTDKPFFVKKYSKGGMSSGMISPDFWTKSAIPLSIGRFKKIKTNGNILYIA